MDSSPILITGSCGHIGSNLTDELISRNIRVFGFDLQMGKISWNELYYQHFQGTITSAENLKYVFDNFQPKIVVHLASSLNNNNDKDNDKDNEHDNTEIAGTLNLLRHCKLYSVKHFIYLSDIEIYGVSGSKDPFAETSKLRPNTRLGRTKLLCEDLISNYSQFHHISATIFRLSPLLDDFRNQRNLVCAITKNLLTFQEHKLPSNNYSFYYLYKKDLISVLVSFLENLPKKSEDTFSTFDIFNLTSGNMPIYTIAEYILTHLSLDKSCLKITDKKEYYYLPAIDDSKIRKMPCILKNVNGSSTLTEIVKSIAENI